MERADILNQVAAELTHIPTGRSSIGNPRGFLNRATSAVRRWASLGTSHRCATCGGPLRRFVEGDLTPEAVRTYRLTGTLGGLLAAGYVCRTCTRPGEWVLVE
jgi:hypothetical protein